MNSKFIFIVLLSSLLIESVAFAQFEPPPQSLLIPEKLETSIGTLNFKDGTPDEKTTQLLYDNLDFLHAQNVFLNTFQGVSTYAFAEGVKSLGAKDN